MKETHHRQIEVWIEVHIDGFGFCCTGAYWLLYMMWWKCTRRFFIEMPFKGKVTKLKMNSMRCDINFSVNRSCFWCVSWCHFYSSFVIRFLVKRQSPLPISLFTTYDSSSQKAHINVTFFYFPRHVDSNFVEMRAFGAVFITRKIIRNASTAFAFHNSSKFASSLTWTKCWARRSAFSSR